MATTATSIAGASRVAEYPPTSARKEIVADMVADGSTGAAANDIPASVFGLVHIERCSAAVKSDNTLIVVCAPAYDGKSLLGKAAATAAPANIPAGTYRIKVFGY